MPRFLLFSDASGSPVGFAYRENSYSDDNYAFEYYWYEKNLEGDIVAIYDNSGNKVLSYVYDAWGTVTITEHGNVDDRLHLNPFTYRGYIYVKGFDMYYLGSRWYDPAIGRFISPNDLSYLGANGDLLSYNLYAYCSNNPIMFTDPSGHVALTTIIVTGVIVGAVIGGVIGGVVAYNAGQASNLEENDLMISTAIGVCEGAIIGSVAGGLISSTGGVIAAYGKDSIIATAMITSTSTITAKVTELCALQIKQSLNEGLNGWQVANNCIDSIFGNGSKLLFPALTKVGTTGFSYLITDISKYKVTSLALGDYLKSSGGKFLSYTSVAYAWCHTTYSMICIDPASRAIQRGYNIK